MFKVLIAIVCMCIIIGGVVGDSVSIEDANCIFFPPTIDTRTRLPIPAFEKCPKCELPFVCYDGFCRHIECNKWGCAQVSECIGP